MKSDLPIDYRPDIDGLRGIAVLLVVFFHANIAFPGGYIGVDVFFVISGYLITRLILVDLENGTFSLTRFWFRRIRRIVPILLVVILATLLCGLIHLWPDDLEILVRSAISILSLVSNVYFWSDLGYFSGAVETQPLLHTWSLAVEEQFYLLYPLILVFLFRKSGSGKINSILFLLFAASLILSLVIFPRSPSTAFYLLPFRAWELLLGGILATRSAKAAPTPLTNNLIGLLGLATLIFCSITYTKSTPFPSLFAIAPVLGTAAVIFSGSNSNSINRIILSNSVLVLIGLISYSLYLWHWPILIFARIRFFEVPNIEFWALAVSFLLSIFTWKFIEQPFRRFSTSGSQVRNFVGLMTLTILLIAIFSHQTNGIPGRLLAFGSLARDSQFEVSDSKLLSMSGKSLGNQATDSEKDKEKLDFMVIGDSHAGVMLPMFNTLANELNASGLSLARAGRKPFGDRKKYRSINDALIRMIEKHRPTSVFLVARWSNLFGQNVPDRLFDANLRLVERLVDTGNIVGSKIWLVSQVPGYDMPRATMRYMIAPPLGANAFHTYPQIDMAQWRKRTHKESSAFASLLERGASVADLDQVFFDTTGKHTVLPSKTILYWDDNHLTQAGAIELLLPVFRPVLRGQTQ